MMGAGAAVCRAERAGGIVPEKVDKPYPKTAALPGSLQARYVRCGKPSCRCARGELHGPYIRRVYWEAGRQRRRYVPLAAVEATRVALAAWQEQRAAVRAERRAVRLLRGQLAAMRRLLNDLAPVGKE